MQHSDKTTGEAAPVEQFEYVGFWRRVGATIIDAVLIAIIASPLSMLVYGTDYWRSEAFIQGPADLLINWVFPAVAIIFFWKKRQATPGKMAVSARILDARTGEPASTGQYIGRYFAYFISALPFLLGFIWVAFDKRKQGWHDKLANTIVIET